MTAIPLIVDLDGTLLRSDLLLESGMAFARAHPLQLLRLGKWLMKGKPELKAQLARATDIDVSVLPYNPAVISLIEAAREAGRPIVLATASHQLLAERVAAHFGFFDAVLATDATKNLSAHKKRDALVGLYGKQGFDYVGNSSQDLSVWKAARHAYVVDAPGGVMRRAQAHGNVAEVLTTSQNSLKTWSKALRVHQWVKNALIFVPLLAAHQVGNVALWATGLLAFVMFGMCASSVYILNDLLDLADDRRHATKRNRPFASGKLSIAEGVVVFPLLLLLSFGLSLWLLPLPFASSLATYYAITLSYSLVLKRQMAVDVIILAILYTMRILAGVAVFQFPLTFWLLAFSLFMFLSLALVKRYTELRDARQKGRSGKTSGRGYYPEDLEMISSLGSAAGYLAVMVLALYIRDQDTIRMYRHPEIIWLACPVLLFWVTRIWLLSHRGLVHEDPVVFALRDRVSLFTVVVFCVVFWAAA